MFLSCGEALFDLFVGGPDSAPHAIALDGRVGGSPLNVALGLARMGNHSRYFTHLSKDLFGQRIRAFLSDNSIDDSLCPQSERNSTLAVVETRADGSAQYSFYTQGTADCSITPGDLPVIPDDVAVLHFGSFSTVAAPTGDAMQALAEREASRRFISYDPNLRVMVVPDMDLWHARLNALLPHAGFVKASDEDVETLFPGAPLEAFCEKALVAGADIACVTRGPDGVILASADGRLMHLPGHRVTVADTVGAGDTFQAACLHYLGANGLAQRGKARDVDLAALGDFALRAAAVTCSRRGADLPTLADIDNFKPHG